MVRLAMIVLGLAVLCCACAPAEQVTPVTAGFRCVAQIEYDGASAQAILDRTAADKTVITFVHPEELVGLSMVYENGELSASYAGVTLHIDEERIPVANAAKRIDSLLAQLASSATNIQTCYTLEDGRVETDPDSGLPIRLEMTTCDLVVLFSQWEFPSNSV